MYKNALFAVLAFSIIFLFLFYKQWLGINLVLFEGLYFLYLFIIKKWKPNTLGVTLFAFTSITLLFSVINYSVYTYIIHFLVFIICIGFVNYNNFKSTLNAFGNGLESIFINQLQFFTELGTLKIKNQNIGSVFKKYALYVIPIFIIFMFIIMYGAANPIFGSYTSILTSFLSILFSSFFKYINVVGVAVFLLGLFISNVILLKNPHQEIIKTDKNATQQLTRKRNKWGNLRKLTSLKSEYKVAVFLLFILNILITLLNISDVIWVWFNFEWEGETLKQFVHEGTYLLIFSIVISIFITLYFFRKNLNFYPNNTLLKTLSYIWLFQNAFLAISVIRRNLWYIDYFNLAYKRIGVFIFVTLVLFGLFTVYKKVKLKKTTSYLLKTNSFFMALLLTISSLPNWDLVIAKYNFSHYKTSYLHLDWLEDLSSKTLPYLIKNEVELNEIKKTQLLLFKNSKFKQDYENYNSFLERRIEGFKTHWEAKPFLSWNYAEWKAYHSLFVSSP